MSGCKICGNQTGNKTHQAREMMFGLREVFPYLECGECGCVQLLQIPSDMSRYYPGDYYSYRQHGALMTFLRHRWSAYAFGSRSLIGWFLSEFVFQNTAMESVRRLKIPRQTRILDVGCGSGHLLRDLYYLGFQNLAGVDPFIARDLEYENGLTVFKRELKDMHGHYDLVMMHHCFEHMDHPGDTLASVAGLLAPTGRIVLRIPVASSFGWRHYGVNWVNLDAPRHFYLHTDKSIQMLAQQAGLQVSESIQEADEGVFIGSEAYARDIPMNDPRFPNSSALKRLINRRHTLTCRAKAKELNRRGESDMVCFLLSKAVS